MQVRRRFEQLSGTSRIGILALTLSILIAAIEFLTHLKEARELMAAAVSLGLKIEPEKQQDRDSGMALLRNLPLDFSLLYIFLTLDSGRAPKRERSYRPDTPWSHARSRAHLQKNVPERPCIRPHDGESSLRLSDT
jgi:hypothetical protein